MVCDTDYIKNNIYHMQQCTVSSPVSWDLHMLQPNIKHYTEFDSQVLSVELQYSMSI